MKKSICIEMLLKELDFYERIKVASELGFDAVEIWSTEEKDLKKLKEYLEKYNIELLTFVLHDSWDNSLLGDSKAVIQNTKKSVEIAKEMNVNKIIMISGNTAYCSNNHKQKLIDNIKFCNEIAEKEGISFILEALNTKVDHKGYYLDSSQLTFDIIREVNSNNIFMLYDIYHMQIMEGNIIDTIKNNIDLIGHFHCAGVPGRNEPNAGELNYKEIVNVINESGYKEYFGFEYIPTYESVQSIKDVINDLDLKK